MYTCPVHMSTISTCKFQTTRLTHGTITGAQDNVPVLPELLVPLLMVLSQNRLLLCPCIDIDNSTITIWREFSVPFQQYL